MEYESLLPPGFHDISEAEIDNHFLLEFQSSKTRPTLIAGLHKFLRFLRGFNIPFEVWIDGSFSTKKLDPNDIDLVVFAESNAINQLDLQHQQLLTTLFYDRISTKHHFGCDAYFALTDNAELRSYWRGWFCFDRKENPKGIAKLAVLP
jgi:hypothetical protein